MFELEANKAQDVKHELVLYVTHKSKQGTPSIDCRKHFNRFAAAELC
jgi:hypothetical protein